MALTGSITSHRYVGFDAAPQSTDGVRKSTFWNRNKNLQLSVYVPEHARVSGAPAHVATGVNRRDYHTIRKFSEGRIDAQKAPAQAKTVAANSERIIGAFFGEELKIALTDLQKTRLATLVAESTDDAMLVQKGLASGSEAIHDAIRSMLDAGRGETFLKSRNALINSIIDTRLGENPSADIAANVGLLADCASTPAGLLMPQEYLSVLKSKLENIKNGCETELLAHSLNIRQEEALHLNYKDKDGKETGKLGLEWRGAILSKQEKDFGSQLAQVGNENERKAVAEKLQAVTDELKALSEDEAALDLQSFNEAQVKLGSLRSSVDKLGFVIKQLESLANNQALRDTFSQIGEPGPNSGLVREEIRKDLARDASLSIGSKDARHAVLGALLTPLRQGQVGSCFVTSVIIQMQQERPQELAAQLKTLIAEGCLVGGRRGVRVDHVPTRLPAYRGDSGSAAPESGLLRTLEYTLASSSPVLSLRAQRAFDTSVDRFLKGAFNEVKRSMPASGASQVDDEFLSEIQQRARKDFVFQHVTGNMGGVYSDGHSTQGGWVLCHRNNADSLTWDKILTEDQFVGAMVKIIEAAHEKAKAHEVRVPDAFVEKIKSDLATIYQTHPIKLVNKNHAKIDPWHFERGGGQSTSVLAWLNSSPAQDEFISSFHDFQIPLRPAFISFELEANPHRTPKKLFTDIVTAFRGEPALQQIASQGSSVLVSGWGHAYSLISEDWKELVSTDPMPDVTQWTKDKLKSPPFCIRIADTNWEEKGNPTYLALGNGENGQPTIGWLSGGRFEALSPKNANYEKILQEEWEFTIVNS